MFKTLRAALCSVEHCPPQTSRESLGSGGSRSACTSLVSSCARPSFGGNQIGLTGGAKPDGSGTGATRSQAGSQRPEKKMAKADRKSLRPGAKSLTLIVSPFFKLWGIVSYQSKHCYKRLSGGVRQIIIQVLNDPFETLGHLGSERIFL